MPGPDRRGDVIRAVALRGRDGGVACRATRAKLFASGPLRLSRASWPDLVEVRRCPKIRSRRVSQMSWRRDHPSPARWPSRFVPPLLQSRGLRHGRSASSCSAACGRADARRQATGCHKERRGLRTCDRDREHGRSRALRADAERVGVEVRDVLARLRARDHPRVRTLYTGSSSRFVASTTVPIATGWNDSCRVGTSPT